MGRGGGREREWRRCRWREGYGDVGGEEEEGGGRGMAKEAWGEKGVRGKWVEEGDCGWWEGRRKRRRLWLEGVKGGRERGRFISGH